MSALILACLLLSLCSHYEAFTLEDTYSQGTSKLKPLDTEGKLSLPVDVNNEQPTSLVQRKKSNIHQRSLRYADERSDKTFTENYCEAQTSFDAAANIRNELFFFKGNYFWRVTKAKGVISQRVPMSTFWTNFTGIRIDASFTRPTDQVIVFISGNQYWVYFDHDRMDPKSPYSICDFGLCKNERIDAAVVWGANRRVYIFSRDYFWKLDDKMAVEIGYPKNISELRGIPRGLDAAVEDFDRKIYFLKGQRCWNWNDDDLSIDINNSDFIGSKWFECNRSSYESATARSYLDAHTSGPSGGAKPNFQDQIATTLTFVCVSAGFTIVLRCA